MAGHGISPKTQEGQLDVFCQVREELRMRLDLILG